MPYYQLELKQYIDTYIAMPFSVGTVYQFVLCDPLTANTYVKWVQMFVANIDHVHYLTT